ncbi:hypothetical protein TRFO_15722 [Tritrichomonas foetus]|uniref:Uncharacterized protein n=1 Tax=Tritrichomonas foetus TaxID=1144522 RepID=A0A1J4KW86_9EUKA|nr:hypothetical protein TRFO_15722 [Tritrichomonas foetus]|eukprot:OHT13958.1 hypothetical protein TRFO_15722 [Tritrichomonas foetus]
MSEETENEIEHPDECTDAELESINIPRFQLIPGFNFSSLYFLGFTYANFTSHTDIYQLLFHCLENRDPGLLKDSNSSVVDLSDHFKFLLNHTSALSEFGDETNEILMDFGDSREGLVETLKNFMANLSMDKEMKFIEMKDTDTPREFIIQKLSEEKIFLPQIIFYSDKGVSSCQDIPYKYLFYPLKPKEESSKNEKDNKNDKWNELCYNVANNFHHYYGISHIIGSEKGIVILYLVTPNCVLKIYDNQTESVGSLSKALKHTKIYFVSYVCDGLNYELNFSPNNLRSNNSIHERINTTTDSHLLSFLFYMEMNQWTKTYTLLEYLIESIQYPTFFGLGCGFEVDPIGHAATIIMGSDSNAKDRILDNMNCDDDTKNNIRDFIQLYGNFTIFIRMLIYFLRSLRQSSAKNFDIYLKALFFMLPVRNGPIADGFIDLLQHIYRNLNQSHKLYDQREKIEHYCCMVIDDLSQLTAFQKKKYISGAYKDMFSRTWESERCISPTFAIRELKKEFQEISKMINLKEFKFNVEALDYAPKYKFNSNYVSYVAQMYWALEIGFSSTIKD